MTVQHYLNWSEVAYAGERHPPRNGVTPHAGSWETHYIKHKQDGTGFQSLSGRPIHLEIQDPNTIDWEKQLKLVQQSLQHITEDQITIAKFWGTGPPTKQWTPILNTLIDGYKVDAPRAGRILAAFHAGINDAFVVAFHLKYKWKVARPNQLDHTLETILCTPRHPSYPSGHATVSGAAEVIISYFFPAERRRIRKFAEENALSRLYAGVHYPIDNSEGLKLGRQIGRLVVEELKKEYDSNGHRIDKPYRIKENVTLAPPPYEQVRSGIYSGSDCESLLRDTSSTKPLLQNVDAPKPTIYL